MRTWLLVIGGLVVLGILLDSIRRMRSANRDSVNMGQLMRQELGETDPLEQIRAELPNGGARRIDGVEVRQPDRPAKSAAFLAKQGMTPAAEKPVTRPPVSRAKVEPTLDSVPPLDDTQKLRRPPELSTTSQDPVSINPLSISQKIITQKTLTALAPKPVTAEDESDGVDLEQAVPMLMDADEQPTFDDNRDMLMSGGAPVLSKPRVVQRKSSESVTPTAEPEQLQQEVIVINVMARVPEGFGGASLLENILASGLRFGQMNIFHHYLSQADNTALFSMANIVKPGTFDLNNMQSFQTPGVSFFMILPLRTDKDTSAMDVFDKMLFSAKNLARQLNGELRDENRSVMTGQTIEHCRQRISEFTLKKLSRSGKFQAN